MAVLYVPPPRPNLVSRSRLRRNRNVLDYLTEEVLQRQPEHIQSFLLQTSLLKRLSGPLCDAVLGGQGSQQMLERLEASNLFVVSLDDRRRWYRYHRRFVDLLQARLQEAHPIAAIRAYVAAQHGDATRTSELAARPLLC